MKFFIKHFAFFWATKRRIIKACLAGMSDEAVKKMIGEVLASQAPKFCIGHRPYQKNPRKAESQ